MEGKIVSSSETGCLMLVWLHARTSQNQWKQEQAMGMRLLIGQENYVIVCVLEIGLSFSRWLRALPNSYVESMLLSVELMPVAFSDVPTSSPLHPQLANDSVSTFKSLSKLSCFLQRSAVDVPGLPVLLVEHAHTTQQQDTSR